MHERRIIRAHRDALIRLHDFFGTHGWTTYARARNALGNETSEHATSAVSWCAMGALSKMGIELDVPRRCVLVDLNNTSPDKAAFRAALIPVIAELTAELEPIAVRVGVLEPA